MPNAAFEASLGPFSDSLSTLDFSDLGAKGVGYAPHQSPLKEVIDAHSTHPDDTAFGPVRATFLQERLAKCPSPPDGRDPRTGPANGQLCVARDGLGPTQTLSSLPSGLESRQLVEHKGEPCVVRVAGEGVRARR